jgi:hypothetical protein
LTLFAASWLGSAKYAAHATSVSKSVPTKVFEDAPEHLALGVGCSVVGRGEEGDAEEERVDRGVKGRIVMDAASVASG